MGEGMFDYYWPFAMVLDVRLADSLTFECTLFRATIINIISDLEPTNIFSVSKFHFPHWGWVKVSFSCEGWGLGGCGGRDRECAEDMGRWELGGGGGVQKGTG